MYSENSDSNQDNSATEYVRPEQKIYQVATNKNELDWKGFLYQLIYREGLDPWDIDLGILTKTYLEALKSMQDVDFDISGKFLTIAVFLLKTKAENLVEKDLRGIEKQIQEVENTSESYMDEIDSLEDLDNQLEMATVKKKKEKYAIKVRNPIARKRKVNIFDLIKTLEKTFEQSNKRRANFFQKHGDVKYDGPMYEKKPKDLKAIIEELYDIILGELSDKKGHVTFSHISKDSPDKMSILEKFIPLLHLHNQDRVTLKQDNHFGEIFIHKSEGDAE